MTGAFSVDFVQTRKCLGTFWWKCDILWKPISLSKFGMTKRHYVAGWEKNLQASLMRDKLGVRMLSNPRRMCAPFRYQPNIEQIFVCQQHNCFLLHQPAIEQRCTWPHFKIMGWTQVGLHLLLLQCGIWKFYLQFVGNKQGHKAALWV